MMMLTAKDQGMYAPARYQEGDRPAQPSTSNPNSSQGISLLSCPLPCLLSNSSRFADPSPLLEFEMVF